MVELRRVRRFRQTRSIPYLIINHSVDFLKKDNFSGEIKLDTRQTQVQEVRRISHDEYNYTQDAFNFLIELSGKFYQTIAGCPLSAKNPFIEELIDNELINADYQNSILITLYGDYSFDIVDRKMLNELSFRLADLKHTFNVPINKIVLLSDIFDSEKNDKLDKPFNVKPMDRVHKGDIKLFLSKFGK